MEQSVAVPMEIENASWKSALNWSAAILIAIVFLVAGIWKVTDPIGAGVRLAQAKVPQNLSVLAAILLGMTETFTGVLLLLPRYRRWGSILGTLLLLVFMVYIAFFYQELQGQECSCFPWVKRAVGPAFFIGDAIMMVFAIVAGLWTRKPAGLRTPGLVLAGVALLAGVSFAAASTMHRGTAAPSSVLVDGKPYSLEQGKVFVYYFDPECLHCLDAGRRMSKLNWGDTRFVGVAVVRPYLAKGFMEHAGLHGVVSTDLDLLKKTFPYTSAPAGVAIENGHEVQALAQMDEPEPETTLRKLNFAK
jgi:uncharacterized membrane protein YphA (DoxX/SURF4 family)